MSNKIMIAKAVTKFVVMKSVTSVATNIIKDLAPTPVNKREELQLIVGAYVIGGIVADQAVDWADEKLMEGIAFVEVLKQQIQQKKSDNSQ